MVVPEEHAGPYRLALEFRDKIDDDCLPVVSPLSSIPWMEAFLGCDLVASGGKVWAEYGGQALPDIEKLHLRMTDSNPWLLKYIEFIEMLESLPDIEKLHSRMTDSNPWLLKYIEFIEMLGRHFPDTPVGQPLFRGPADLAGVFCGSTGHILNLFDRPAYMRELLDFCETAFIWFAGKSLEATPSFQGGYCLGTYNLWAPERCVRFQEDFTSLYSPELYNRFILDTDRRISEVFPFNLFHMHTSQLPLFGEYLKNEKLRVMQLTRDIDEPSASRLIEAALRVQRGGRAVLLRGAFNEKELEQIRRVLSPAGLYIQNVLRLDELNKMAERSRAMWS
jgi:hypothetical protein